jgi:hypothetical protein
MNESPTLFGVNGSLELFGTNGFEEGEAGEVASIQGKDAFDAVDVHGGGDAGVVDLDAGYALIYQETTPDRMYCGVVGEHWDLIFDHPRPPVGLLWGQAEAVAIQRPCQNVPALAQVLRGVAGKVARPNKKIDSSINRRLQGSPDSSQRIRMLLSSRMRMAGLRVIAVDAFPS